MTNKIPMTYEVALQWVDLAIRQDKKDIAIDILKDLLNQAVERIKELENTKPL